MIILLSENFRIFAAKRNKRNVYMKKIIYYITVGLLLIVGWPVMLVFPDKWNKFGRRIDKFFEIESPHTKNYKERNNN